MATLKLEAEDEMLGVAASESHLALKLRGKVLERGADGGGGRLD